LCLLEKAKEMNYKIILPPKVSLFGHAQGLRLQGPLGIQDVCFAGQKGAQGFALSVHQDHLERTWLSFSHPSFQQNLQSLKQAEKLAYVKTLGALLVQKAKGVTQGAFVHLELVGIGYRALVEKKDGKSQVTLKVGFSHEIQIPLPSSLLCFSKKPTQLSLYSLDLPEVQQFASKLTAYKKPEPYKGKGLRFQGQVIPLRIGKKK
jgi:ribosomal protein L6P/L9E